MLDFFEHYGEREVAETFCLVIFPFISLMKDIGVWAPLDLGGGGGGGDLIARKKLHHARKHVLYKRTQIIVKTKTCTILTSNERIIIPKLQLKPNFSNLQGKQKLFRKTRYFERSGATKITMFH